MTLIIPKFDYKFVDRIMINGKRHYVSPDGTPLASVTTILDATADKSGLDDWRKRIGEFKANEITTEAANVGTRMHKYLEDYIETGVWSIPGSNLISQQAHKMATKIKEHAFCDISEIWGSEVRLYYPELYAGTTDLVGIYRGNPAILDYKQSNREKKKEYIVDYYIQLCLYIIAHNNLFGTNIKEGHILVCTRDLVYQQFDIWPDDFNYWKEQAWNRVYDYYKQLD